jgi:hypothetical protein
MTAPARQRAAARTMTLLVESVSIGYPFERNENSEPIIDLWNTPLSTLNPQLSTLNYS